MKTSRGQSVVLLCVAVLGGITMLAAARPSQELTSSGLRVGVFDSRAVLFAWVASDTFKAILTEKSAEFEKAHKEAKEAGDEALVQKLEAGMRAIQEEIHKQGFSIWPVRNILAHIEDDLEKIAAQAKVDVIVCKWDLAYQHPKAELVDVTHLMIEPFDPDEETLQGVKEILSQEPVPLEDLKKHGGY